jgi:hypothetical protein
MGYNARNDETRQRRADAARMGSAEGRARGLSVKGYVWFWPKITAALTSKHHWLIIACDAQQRSGRSSAQGFAQMTGYNRGYYGGYYRRY